MLSIDLHTLTQLETSYRDVRVAVALFHERNAWAAGFYIARQHNLPTGFQKPRSYYDYAQFCLGTYAKYYNDNRFVNGMI